MKKYFAAGLAAAFALATVTLADAQMQGSGQGEPSTPGTQGGPGMTTQSQDRQMGQQPGQADRQMGQTGQTAQQQRDRQSQARKEDEQVRQKAASMYLDGKEIMGAKVKDRGGKDVGSVSNLILDKTGKVAFVIVSHGGVAGFGGKNVSVPVGAVTLSGSGEKKQVVLNVSEEQLNSAPEYNHLADLMNPTYTEVTYRFFGLQPQFGEQESTQAQQMQSQESGKSQQSQWHLQDTSGQQQQSR